MFNGCRSLRSAIVNLNKATTVSNFFGSCYNLKSVTINGATGSLTGVYAMFQNCYDLEEAPMFDTQNVTNMSNMFANCYNIRTVPTYNTSKVISIDSMFYACRSIKTIPTFDTSKVTNMNNMFYQCDSLLSIPTFNTPLVTNFSAFAQLCISLRSFPAISGTSSTSGLSSMISQCYISRIEMTNIKDTISVASQNLSKTALLELFGNLFSPVSGKTVTITTNHGADTALSKTSSGTTIGSAVITQSNTTSIDVGMLVTGTGINTPVAVTFTTGTNIVGRTAHGLVNDNIISFTSIVTTTGIVISKPYYVVNANTNDFQVSATLSGSPLTLTNSGSGNMTYGTYVVSVNSGVSFTVDKPASASGSVTSTLRILDTSIATLKGWTVTG